MPARNTKAEMEYGRRVTAAKAEETRISREAWERRKQEERDAEEARRQEIANLGKGYEVGPTQQAEPAPAPEPAKVPLPEPVEVEVGSRVARKKA